MAPRNDKDPSLIKWRPAKDRLIKYYGIDIEKFSSWAKVNELRLLANAVKHADGDSCTELKGLRPDLFVSTHGQTERYELELVWVRPVLQPLARMSTSIRKNSLSTLKQSKCSGRS